MQSPPLIAKENLPGLQRPTLPRHHVDRNPGLRDIDAQFEQLTVDLGSAPGSQYSFAPTGCGCGHKRNKWRSRR